MSECSIKTSIDKLDFKIDLFLNKSTLLIGGAGTGKTKIILDIMNLIKNEISTCYVLSPITIKYENDLYNI